MKNNYILSAFLIIIMMIGCEKKYPEPQMPDVSGISPDFTPFTLKLPSSDATVEVDAANTTGKITISWNRTTAMDKSAVKYKWLAVASTTPTFATPVLSVDSDSTGKAPMLTFTHAQLVTVLQGRNIAEGQSLALKWTVRATSESGKMTMATSAYNVTLYRKPQTLPVTFELANYPASTPTNGKVFLAGKFGQLGTQYSGDWNQPGTVSTLEAVKDPVSNTYKITFQIAPNTTIDQFKWFFVPNGTASTWSNGEARFGFAAGAEEGMPNRSWTFTGTNSSPRFSVAKWENIGSAPAQLNKIEVTLDPAIVVPADKFVYVAGEISGTPTYTAYFANSSQWQQPGTNPANQLTFDSGSGKWFVWLPIGAGARAYKPFVSSGDVNAGANEGWSRGMAKLADCSGENNQSFTFTLTNGPSINVVRFEKVAPCPL
jgi:hypothetical protein